MAKSTNRNESSIYISKNKAFSSFMVKSEMFLVYAMIIITTICALLDRTFISTDNIIAFVKSFSFLGIMAVPLTFLFISLCFDMSIGQMTALSGAVAGIMMRDFNLPFIVIIPIALIIGLLCGTINGLLVTRFNINAFIATLGTLYIYKGIYLVIADQKTVSGIADKIMPIPDYILYIPLNTWALIAVAIIGAIILMRSRFGRSVFAVGNNVEFAKEIGIKQNRVKMILFMVTGICAGICGVITLVLFRSLPAATGVRWEFLVTAGCMLGGCSIYGGKGSVGGSLIGVGFMTLLQFALRSWQVYSYLQLVILGIVLIVAVMIDTIKEKKIA